MRFFVALAAAASAAPTRRGLALVPEQSSAFQPRDPPIRFPLSPLCVCLVVAALLVGAELAALGLYAQWLRGILDGSGRPTGEIAVFTATEHLEGQLAPAVRSNALKGIVSRDF